MTDAVRREISYMLETAKNWRRPEFEQIEGPNDLKIYGGTIANDIDRWADMLASLMEEVRKTKEIEGFARPVHIVRASGSLDEQKQIVRGSQTYQRGDTVLCWVNEGDLYANPSVKFEDLTGNK